MPGRELVEGPLTWSVIGAFYDVYNDLGFGHSERIYKAALERELIALGHKVGREVPVMVMYKGEALAMERIDMIVDGKLVVEVKASAELHASAMRQTYGYLRASHLQVGLVLHFGLEAKFHRVVELRHKPARMTKDTQEPTETIPRTDAAEKTLPVTSTDVEAD